MWLFCHYLFHIAPSSDNLGGLCLVTAAFPAYLLLYYRVIAPIFVNIVPS